MLRVYEEHDNFEDQDKAFLKIDSHPELPQLSQSSFESIYGPDNDFESVSQGDQAGVDEDQDDDEGIIMEHMLGDADENYNVAESAEAITPMKPRANNFD